MAACAGVASRAGVKFVLLRHGQSLANVAKIIVSVLCCLKLRVMHSIIYECMHALHAARTPASSSVHCHHIPSHDQARHGNDRTSTPTCVGVNLNVACGRALVLSCHLCIIQTHTLSDMYQLSISCTRSCIQLELVVSIMQALSLHQHSSSFTTIDLL